MFPTSMTAGENRANFLPCIVQFDWLISDQLRYSLNIYQFDCSVLCFPNENSSNKSTKSTSCFIFLFDISKITKLMNKFWKGPRWVFPARFDEKLRDFRENQESWQIWLSVVNEYYGTNYSSLNNGFKFHALRGWIFVLPVLDCNEKYWYFFLYRKSLNMYKFMEL